ncbi:MAG TPA: hypothetical protein VFV09_14300 [Actinomycetota bacterium]|jgi:hypothetical protein|nr:hypothetical protein [Actinomycetota bacterium]
MTVHIVMTPSLMQERRHFKEASVTNGFPGLTNSGSLLGANPNTEEVIRNTEAAREVVLKMADMLDGLSDTSIPVPRSEWNVGEHGAHIAFANIGFGMFAMGLEYPYSDGTQAGLAEENEVSLIGFPEREGSALAQHLRSGIDNFIGTARAGDPDQVVSTPLGKMPLGTLSSYFLIHNLMHGCAISSALNHDFPVEPEHLPMLWPLVVAKFNQFVNLRASRGVEGTVHVSVPGYLETTFKMENSYLTILPGAEGTADCRVEADATHFFLVLIKLLSVPEAIDLGYVKTSGSNPFLFGRIMNAVDVP